MNLEEELSTLNSTSTIITANENQANSQVNIMPGQNLLNDSVIPSQTLTNDSITVEPSQLPPMGPAPIEAPVQPAPTYGGLGNNEGQTFNQPAMVNTNQAQSQISEMNFANLDFDINKPLFDTNPVQRLTGEKGQTFRLHLLPGISPQKVDVHWDAEKGHNIICLRNVYSTTFEPCCTSHGQSKSRLVIPVIVYNVQGQQQVMPGSQGELKFLVLSPGKLKDLQDQAEYSGTKLEVADIFATVDNPQYKSFNFAVNANTMIQNISNVQALTEECKRIMTPQNVCGACGKVITREEYEAGYKNYDKAKYDNKTNTPTQAAPMTQMGPVNYGQPMQPGQFTHTYDPTAQPYGSFGQGQF